MIVSQLLISKNKQITLKATLSKGCESLSFDKIFFSWAFSEFPTNLVWGFAISFFFFYMQSKFGTLGFGDEIDFLFLMRKQENRSLLNFIQKREMGPTFFDIKT